MSVRGTSPEIWRRVSIPDNLSLHQLHRVFQLIFGWLDYHLYQFSIGGRKFGARDEEAEDEDASATYLWAVCPPPGEAFEYLYDFGDYWMHDVTVEEIVAPLQEVDDELPHLLDGELPGPPEDSGGHRGYQELATSLVAGKGRKYKQFRSWVGPHYEPARFDPWLANQNLMLAAAWGAI